MIQARILELPASQTEEKDCYLVPLIYQKPTSWFMWPLYLLRQSDYVKVMKDEAQHVKYSQEKGSWSVTLPCGKTFKNLSTIAPFHAMKKACHAPAH